MINRLRMDSDFLVEAQPFNVLLHDPFADTALNGWVPYSKCTVRAKMKA
jgi:hypothetical protein